MTVHHIVRPEFSAFVVFHPLLVVSISVVPQVPTSVTGATSVTGGPQVLRCFVGSLFNLISFVLFNPAA